MQRVIDQVAEHVQRELAVFRDDGLARRPFHGQLVQGAVGDQVGNRAHRQPVPVRELFEFRPPRHRAVLVHDFHDQGRRLEARHAREVDSGFRVACAPQHDARLGNEREDVTGLADVRRARVGAHGHLHRVRPLHGTDARSAALGRVDRDREVGFVLRAVVAHHER